MLSSRPIRTWSVADPGFDLVNPDWPIFSQQWNVPPAKFLHDSRRFLASVVEESIVALGSQILARHDHRKRSWAMGLSGQPCLHHKLDTF